MYRISTGRVKAASSLLAALLLAGCSSLGGFQMKEATQTPVVTGGDALSPEVSSFLSDGMNPSSRYFASTYWGDNVELAAGATYFAASGRHCRPLTVDSGAGSQSWLACEGGNGRWVAVRSVR